MTSLRDMYEDDEIPTRPDCPRASARLCKHCGKAYGDHAEKVSARSWYAHVTMAGCWGIRPGFEPEEQTSADAGR